MADDQKRREVGILIIESIDILYNMLEIVEELYLVDEDPNFNYGDYITSKLSIEENIAKLLNK